MKLILRADVENLGNLGDVVTVTQAPELDLVNTALLPMLWHRAAVLAGGASPAAPEADGTTIQKEELA